MAEAHSERNPVELLAEEFLDRVRRGEQPQLAEYVQRHPNLADEIRELFPMLLDLEHAIPETDDGPDDPKETVARPSQIGDYRIVREIGRGGMGIVYEAIQQSLSRRVALKVLGDSSHDDMAWERFRREARAAAQLHHTNIVPVFDVGEETKTCYYAMQFIQGQPLHAVIQEMRFHVAVGGESTAFEMLSPSPFEEPVASVKPDSTIRSPATTSQEPTHKVSSVLNSPMAGPGDNKAVHDVLRGTSVSPFSNVSKTSDLDYRQYFHSVALVGSQVSQALAYAHQRGVVHRDIKPSNLLLDTRGVIWVADFGMAKTDAEPLTRTGDILGTLHYMAPERFQGQCDERADIYATGLTIYELLTLSRAFDSDDRLQLIKLISHHEPSPPRSLNARVPRDLETIVLKAIDKDPARRYQTAREMADDFQCYLEDRPIHARRIGTAERFVRWTRRNPVLSGLSIVIAVGLLLAAVGASISTMILVRSNNRAVQAEREAVQAEQVAAGKAEELLQQSYINWVNLAYFECRNDNVARAREYLELCPRDQRGWEWHFVRGQCQVALRSMIEKRPSVNCLDLSPDGKWIAIGTGNFLNRRGPPGDLVVRDVWSGEQRFPSRELANGVTAVAFSPDGSRIATANGSQLIVWNAETGRQLFAREGTRHDLLALEFSPDGTQIVGAFGRFNNASHVGFARRWNARTGEEIGKPLPGRAGGVWDVAFDPSGRRLAVTSSDVVEVWDVEHQEVVLRLPTDAGFTYCVAYDPRGRYVAAGGLDRTIRLWDAEDGELVRTFTGHSGFVRGLAFSSDGLHLVSASEDKSVRLWNVESSAATATFHGHTHFVNCVAFSANGKIVASGSLDRSAKIWFASDDQQLVYRGHMKEGHVKALAFSPDGRQIASGSLRFAARGRLHLWDATTGERTLRFPQNVDEVASLDFSSGGDLLAAGHVSGEVTVWDQNANQLAKMNAHIGEVTCVAFSPDATQLASVGTDRGLALWEPKTGVAIRVTMEHEAPISSVAFSPDGKLIATASEDGTVLVRDAKTGHLQGTLRHPHGGARYVAFSPDATQIVSTGGIDHQLGDVIVWDARSGQQLARLKGHTDIVYAVDFSPDGSRFATASDDRTIKLWDADSKRNVFTIRGHTGGVVSLAFSPDGKQLASGGVDRTVRVWDINQPEVDIRFERDAAAELEAGQSLMAQHRWPEALTAFRRAKSLGFDSETLHTAWADAATRQDPDHAGTEEIASAVASVTGTRRRTSLALQLVRRGHREQAARLIEAGMDAARPDVIATLARIHAALGEPEIAREHFLREANRAASDEWFATGWWTGRPPAESSNAALDRMHGPIRAFDVHAAEGLNAETTWLPAESEGDHFLDFEDPWTPTEPSTAYALQYLYTKDARRVVFLLGADEGSRLWLNGELQFQQTRGSLRPDHRPINVPLRPGWNRVLIEVDQVRGPHGLYFRVSDHARDLCRGALRQNRLEDVVEFWNQASPVERTDAGLLDNVGNTLARLGRWEQAADVFEELVRQQPTRNRNWVSLAPLLVHTKRHDRYQVYRKELLKAFGNSTTPINAERTSKASLLLPVDVAEAELPRRLATDAATRGASHGLAPYFLFARGMSEYRAGDWDAALTTLDQARVANRSRWPYLDVVVHLFLALTHHGLEDAQQAQTHLKTANEIFADRLPASDSSDFGADWLDWLICEVVRREANQVLAK